MQQSQKDHQEKFPSVHLQTFVSGRGGIAAPTTPRMTREKDLRLTIARRTQNIER
jgi:hypothetical protein